MEDHNSPLELATALTIAWLGNSHTRANTNEVPAFLNSMMAAVVGLIETPEPEAAPATEHVAATTSRKSLASPDQIISMIDGKPYKTLRRHLSSNGLSPEEYRTRYGLKADYPMVAESYSIARREMAHKIGLGRKPDQKVKPASDKPAKAPRRAKSDAAPKE